MRYPEEEYRREQSRQERENRVWALDYLRGGVVICTQFFHDLLETERATLAWRHSKEVGVAVGSGGNYPIFVQQEDTTICLSDADSVTRRRATDAERST